MKLSQLASKPQLVLFKLDDKETIKEFGEPLEFYSWDRQSLENFMKLANANHNEMSSIIDIVRKLILDENGKEIITEENTLPSNVMVKVITKVVEKLGKS
jgi:hypothetical protein